MGLPAEIGMLLLQAAYFLLPAYFANMAPVLCKDVLKPLAIPIDGDRTLRGKEILGDHKTWRGVIVATIAGMFVFWLQQLLYQFVPIQKMSLFNYSTMPMLSGALLGFGAILGDAVKSFAKRRIGVKPGVMWFPFDQIDYPIGAMLLGSAFFIPPAKIWAAGILLSIILSLLVNYCSFKLGWKDVPF